MRKPQDCAVCKIVRLYLLLAAPLLIVLGSAALDSTGEKSSVMWFARVELIEFLANGTVVVLFVIVCFKAYQEYWLPKKRARALDELLKNNASNEKSSQ